MAIVEGTNINDSLKGGGGDDTLIGKAGDDILKGFDGDDILIGGAGKDILTGGSGADTFGFNLVSESPVGIRRDKITDFNSQEGDKIDLSTIDAYVGLAGNQPFREDQLSYDSDTGIFTAVVIDGAVLQVELSDAAGFDLTKDVITAPPGINLNIDKDIFLYEDMIAELGNIGKFIPDIPLPGPVCLSCLTEDSAYDILFSGRPNPQPSINFYDDVLLDNVSHNVELIGNLSLVDTFDVIF